MRRQNQNSTSACAAMPRVADPASTRDHLGRPVIGRAGAVGVDAEQRREHEQAGDRDDVVEHRHPGERPEAAPGVEHLAEQRVEAVEEDLRQAPPGEGDREVEGLAVGSVAP